MRRSQKRGDKKKHQRKKTKELVTEKRTLGSGLSNYDRVTQAIPRTIFIFYILNTSSKPPMFITFFSKIRLVLFPTLYKFIVWACWAKTQSCLGSKPKLVLTIAIFFILTFFLLILFSINFLLFSLTFSLEKLGILFLLIYIYIYIYILIFFLATLLYIDESL